MTVSSFTGYGNFASLVEEGLEYEVKISKKMVDATITKADLPFFTEPKYQIGDGVNHVPINELSRLKKPWKKYIVIGAGKTGVDAILHLLDEGLKPDRITWIVSNDCWFISRFQQKDARKVVETTYTSILNADNIDDLHQRLEGSGLYHRLDKSILPTRMRGATVTSQEMAQLRTVTNVIRRGCRNDRTITY